MRRGFLVFSILVILKVVVCQQHSFPAVKISQIMFLVDNSTNTYGNAKYWGDQGTLTNYCELQSGFIAEFNDVSFPDHKDFIISEDTEISLNLDTFQNFQINDKIWITAAYQKVQIPEVWGREITTPVFNQFDVYNAGGAVIQLRSNSNNNDLLSLKLNDQIYFDKIFAQWKDQPFNLTLTFLIDKMKNGKCLYHNYSSLTFSNNIRLSFSNPTTQNNNTSHLTYTFIFIGIVIIGAGFLYFKIKKQQTQVHKDVSDRHDELHDENNV